MSFESRRSLGVIVCNHVLNGERNINYVCHDAHWQFLCGEDDHFGPKSGSLVGLGHLLDMDKSISELSSLEVGYEANRDNCESCWIVTKIEQ